MYRKFKADGIFTGLELLYGHVLITEPDGQIVDLVKAADAGDDIEDHKGLLSPGFINCHCHIELSYLKDLIPQHTGLVDFVQVVMSKRNVSSEIKQTAMRSAAEELYNSGTVAVGDICNNDDSVVLKKHSPLYWNNFIEVSGFVDATAEKRLEEAEKVALEFSHLPYPYAIVPHAPYSVSKNLFRLLNKVSAGKLISIHNQEQSTENELYEKKSGGFLKLYEKLGIHIDGFTPTGKTSLQSWLPYFTNKQKIISVHNTFISQDDIDIARDIIFCICINANLYIENSLPPLELLIKNECKIVLGTDSYASNTQLNILEEMKEIQKNFPSVDTQTVLKWATMNGAEALGITKTYGSFENKKVPGIVLIEGVKNGTLTAVSKARRIL